MGGLSGPAIKPIALRCVHQVAKAVDIPIIGIGGIATIDDVMQFLVTGASAVQIGTANYYDPHVSTRLIDELPDALMQIRGNVGCRLRKDTGDLAKTSHLGQFAMSNDSPLRQLDPRDVATVVDLADHIGRLHVEAVALQQTFETGDRGYFTPSEDDQVLHLWISYHKSRSALLELIDSVRRSVGHCQRRTCGRVCCRLWSGLDSS